MKHATHVVVDTHDGYTFWRGADGQLFTEQAATAFADSRNAEMKPEHQLYAVFYLMSASEHAVYTTLCDEWTRYGEGLPGSSDEACDECGAQIPGELISDAHAESCSGHPRNVAA